MILFLNQLTYKILTFIYWKTMQISII